MATNYVEIERPNGFKKAILRWDNEILIIGCAGVCLILAFGIVSVFHVDLFKTSLLSVSVIGILTLIFPLMTIFVWKNHKRLDRHYKHCFDLLKGDRDIIHCAPTHLGWIACGANWISTTISAISATRLEAHEIGNVYWGGRLLEQSQLVKNYPVEINMRKISPISNLYWLLILARDDTNKSIFVTFRKKSEMKAWVKIVCDLASSKPLNVGQPRSAPTKWQFACKAKIIPLSLISVELIALGLYAWLFAADRAPRGNQFLLPLIMFIYSGLIFQNSSRGMSANVTHNVLIALNGGELPGENSRVPAIAGKNLILNHTRYPGFEWVEQIPLSEISRVKLEDWGHSFDERDLNKIFDKSVQPKNLVIRLYLDRTEDNEREIRLGREDAIAWHKTLNDLVPSK